MSADSTEDRGGVEEADIASCIDALVHIGWNTSRTHVQDFHSLELGCPRRPVDSYSLPT